MPGRVARVLTSLTSASRWACFAARSRSSDARWTRSAAARAPSTIRSSSTRGSMVLTGSTRSMSSNAPVGSSFGQQHLGDRRTRHALRSLLEIGPDLVRTVQVGTGSVVLASACGQHASLEPNAGLVVGGAGGSPDRRARCPQPPRGLPWRAGHRARTRMAPRCFPERAAQVVKLSRERPGADAGLRLPRRSSRLARYATTTESGSPEARACSRLTIASTCGLLKVGVRTAGLTGVRGRG